VFDPVTALTTNTIYTVDTSVPIMWRWVQDVNDHAIFTIFHIVLPFIN